MPPKAKRSAKKNKGKKKVAAAVGASTSGHPDTITNHADADAPAVAAATANAAATTRMPPVVNTQDDPQRILRWLRSGRIDMKRLNKYMPATADDLRSGSCDPEALAAALAPIVMGSGDDKDNLPHTTQLLVERILSSLPDDSLNVEEYDEMAAEMEEDLRRKIQNEFRRSNFYREEDSAALKQVGTEAMKRGFEGFCKSWESRFDDRFYQGRSGLFLQNCAIYQQDFGEVMDMVAHEAYENRIGIFKAKSLEFTLSEVASDIANGLDRDIDTCWHCSSIRPDMQVCQKCKVACFCTSRCIEEAWPSWHKRVCRQLRGNYIQYCDSIAAVDAAHVSGVLPLCGFELKDKFDYETASAGLSFPSIFTKEVRKKLKGPNMKYFYENLERVVRGEWWLWNNADDVEQDEDYLRSVAHFLMYDYFDYAEHHLNTSNDSALVSWNVMFAPEDFLVDFLEKGPLMSAEVFLKRYSSAKPWAGTADKKQLLEAMKAKAWKIFRENYETGGCLLHFP